MSHFFTQATVVFILVSFVHQAQADLSLLELIQLLNAKLQASTAEEIAAANLGTALTSLGTAINNAVQQTTTGASLTTPTPGSCEDKQPLCGFWAASGQCTSGSAVAYVTTQCDGSCKKCATIKKTYANIAPCMDILNRCVSTSNECSTDVKMALVCARTCGKCPGMSLP